MGFGRIRRVALWAAVLSALGIGVYVLAQGVSAPPPVKLGPGITIKQSAIPTRSRPIAPETPEPSGTTETPASSAPPSSTPPKPTTVIPSKSAPVKPLPPSKADDDDDDDDDRDDIDD